MPPRSIAVREIRTQADTLAKAVVQRKLATADECARARPGGADNPETGPRGWLRYLNLLHRFHARQEVAAQAAAPDERATIDALLTRAIAETAEPVTLTIPDDGGEPRVVFCHPKSRQALLHLHAWDHLAAQRVRAYRFILAEGGQDTRSLDHLVAGINRCVGALCWAVTHAGAWLPFDPLEPLPDLPEWIQLLTPLDTAAILLTHRRVNEEGLRLLSRLLGNLSPDRNAQSELAGWGAFVVQAAPDEGQTPQVLDRHRSLNALVAGVLIRASASEAARKAASA